MTEHNPFWIQTHTPKGRFDLSDPRAEDVRIEDIAYALSRLCRFTGHCKRFYSVAQHSIHVAALVAKTNPEWALAALLHDAEEAYIGDISSPLKALIRQNVHAGNQLRLITEGVNRAIGWRFKTCLVTPAESLVRHACIKAADLKMLATERRDLMPEPPDDGADWFAATGVAGVEPCAWPVLPRYAFSIEADFLERFYQYGGQ